MKQKLFIIPIVMIVLAVGFTIPLLVSFLKPAAIVDPKYSPINSNPYPDGTENNPTPLKIGETIKVRLDAIAQSDLEISYVGCNIYDIGDSKRTVAILRLKNIGGNTWAIDWVVPSEYTYKGTTYPIATGSKLEFYFYSYSDVAIEIPTEYGYRYEYESYIRPGPTTYAYISGTLIQSQPEGYFQINGKEATETSIHLLFDPTITFTFTATEHPESISAVKISVNDEVLTLDKVSSTEYRKAYTLPGPGKYEIEGWIVPTYDSSKQIVRMSIVTKYGENEFNRMALGLTILFATSAVILIIILRWFKK